MFVLFEKKSDKKGGRKGGGQEERGKLRKRFNLPPVGSLPNKQISYMLVQHPTEAGAGQSQQPGTPSVFRMGTETQALKLLSQKQKLNQKQSSCRTRTVTNACITGPGC